LDRPTVFAKSLRRGSASTILASVFLVATAFVQAAPSQNDNDALVREVVQHRIQVGTDQYDHGYYAEAEKTFQMAERFKDSLDPVDQRKLQSLREKASQAAVERKKALEAKQAGQELLRKGDEAGARARLESIQSSPFLTEQERLEVAQTLRPARRPQVTAPGSDNAALPAGTSPSVGAGVQSTPASPGGAATQETDRLSELYYQSMLAYHSGDLKKAREGFTEVLKSEGLPAPIAATIRGYVAQNTGCCSSADAELDDRQIAVVDGPTDAHGDAVSRRQ
jgi:TolA-binding protein